MIRVPIAALLLVLTVTGCGQPAADTLRSFDIKAYLLRRGDLGQSLARECGGGAPITNLEVQYADLIGEGDEQAIVEATTCMMGNGGADIVEVLRMKPGLPPVSLILDVSEYSQERLYEGQRRTPRLEARDGRLIQWYVMGTPGPVEKTRTITWRWSGDRFTIGGIKDQPEHPRR